MKIKILLIALAFATLSCNRRVPEVVTISDSTVTTVKREYILKEVPMPADSALIRAYFECDSSGKVLLKTINSLQGDRVFQDYLFFNGSLSVKARDKATKTVEKDTRDSVRFEFKEVPVPYPVEVKVNYLTLFQKGQIWLGRVSLAVIIGAFAFGYIKGKL